MLINVTLNKSECKHNDVIRQHTWYAFHAIFNKHLFSAEVNDRSTYC